MTPIPDLSLPETRERSSGSAIEGFFAIEERWHLSIDQAGALLGDLPRSSAYKLRSTPKTLGRDQLTRISYVVGIFNALHILLPDALADIWMTEPNDNPLFRGRSPLDFVTRTGIPGLLEVPGMLDALRSGQLVSQAVRAQMGRDCCGANKQGKNAAKRGLAASEQIQWQYSFMNAYRENLKKTLQGRPIQSLPHEKILGKINEAGKDYKILVLKTTMTMPNTSVFLLLDCKDCTDEGEQKIRQAMKSSPPN